MGKTEVKPEDRVMWEHEYICRETGEVVILEVPAGDSPPKFVYTPTGKLAYKNFAASFSIIPFYMRAANDHSETYDSAKKMMNGTQKTNW